MSLHCHNRRSKARNLRTSCLPKNVSFRPNRRFRIEPLEERRLLAVDMVSSSLDDGSAGTLRSVIAAASPGDTVEFSSGITQIKLTQGQIEIDKSLTVGAAITSPLIAPAPVTIDAGGRSGIFAVQSTGANVTLNNLVLVDATNAGDGGVVVNVGTLTVNNSTFRSDETLGQGGAIYNLGPLTVFGCTFLGNSALKQGGAIENQGTATISDSTFVANLVTTSAGTGGGAIDNSGTLTIGNCTFSGNYSVVGGSAIDNTSSNSVQLANTIVAHEPNAVSDLAGLINSSYSLIQNPPTSGLTADSHSLLGVDPLLSPLGSYGGPTQTMAPLPGSPALAAGNSSGAPTTDQRGQPLDFAGADMGAFQSASFELTASSGSGHSAPPNTAYAAPLVARITTIVPPGIPQQPVAGGRISWNVVPDVGSVKLSATSTTIGLDGTASVTATANGALGPVVVMANGKNASAAWFYLTNKDTAPVVTSTGGPYAVEDYGQLSLSAQVLDPDLGQTLTVNWDVNGDGKPDATAKVATNGSTVTLFATLTNAQLRALGLFNADGTANSFNVNVTASDGLLNSASATTKLTTIFLGTPPVVTSTGGPYVVGREGELSLSAQVRDPDPSQTLTIDWDVNGDGTPDASATVASNGSTVTAQAMLTNAQLTALGLFNGLGVLSGIGSVVTSRNFTVRVGANDGIFNSVIATTKLTAELGPEGGMKSNGAAFAGQAANVRIFVPNGASASGPLHFSIALDQNALATSYDGASTNDTQSFTFDSLGTYTVFGRMFQPDGAFSDYTTTVDVYAAGQQNALFVDRVYNDLLGRVGSPTGPDNSGPSYWAGQLQNGVTRQDVALAVMSDSGGEYDAQLVMAAFQQYLHRTPEPQALAYFVPLLEARLTVEQFDIGLVSSDEYLNSRGGGTNDGFLDALFGDALGRAVDSGARAAFDAMFAGGVSRAQMADLVFGSAEYENRLVDNMFESLLNRPADPAALAFFTGELNSGLTDQQVMAQIIGSNEFAPLA